MEKESFTPVKFYKRKLIVNYQVQMILTAYSLFLVFAVVGSQYLLQLLAFQINDSDMESFLALRFTIYFAVIVLFLIILFYGFNLTNRIVGPVYRLKYHMESINLGQDPKPFSVRKNDYFKEIVEPYNEIIKKIKK